MTEELAKRSDSIGSAGHEPARPLVDIVATLPPPVNGNTLITQRVIQWLREHCEAHVFAITSSESLGHLAAKGIRAWKNLAACLWLLSRPRPAQGAVRNLYLVANAGVGMFYTLFLLGLARLRGYRCTLHHHSYSYISRFDWRMKLVDRVIGKDGCHVVSCPDMGSKLAQTYHSTRRWFAVPNTFMMPAADVPCDPHAVNPAGLLTIGHLSNLCFEKGIDTVIEVFSELRRSNLPVRLVLAGPSVSQSVAKLIERAKGEFGDAVDYRGAVQGDEKWAFFNEIDLFLFPTRYRIEAQPVVVFEALSFGRPVIAFGRGCIPGMLDSEGGYVIDVEDDFVDRAKTLIQDWIARPEEFRRQASHAWSRGQTLRASAEPGLRRLVQALGR